MSEARRSDRADTPSRSPENLDEAAFQALGREGYNRVPIVHRADADLETPLSIYLKLAHRSYTYLLESVIGGERFGRYSYIGLAAPHRIEAVGRHVTVKHGEKVLERSTGDDPLEFVRSFLARYRAAPVPELPRFAGGLVGYFGYDTVRWIEPSLAGGWLKPDVTAGPSGACPDMLLLLSDELALLSLAEDRNPDGLGAFSCCVQEAPTFDSGLWGMGRTCRDS